MVELKVFDKVKFVESEVIKSNYFQEYSEFRSWFHENKGKTLKIVKISSFTDRTTYAVETPGYSVGLVNVGHVFFPPNCFIKVSLREEWWQ